MGSTAKPSKRVLLYFEFADPKLLARLEQYAEVTQIPPGTQAETTSRIQKAVQDHGPFDCFTISTHPQTALYHQWGESMLASLLPYCGLITRVGTGYDNLDVDWMAKNGIYYANNPKAVARTIAMSALALLMTAGKGITTMDTAVKNGGWLDDVKLLKTLDLENCTVGILGMGAAGTILANHLAALDIKTIYHSRTPKPELPYPSVSLDELYAMSDAIVLLLPLTNDTKGMIDKNAFGKMKDGVVFVNVARGPIVIEQDPVDALNSGKVSQAALDVFENEPHVHPELRKHDRATLTPYAILGYDVFRPKVEGEMIENVIQFLKTGKPNTPVNDPKR